MANDSSLSKRAALRRQQELEERQKRTKRIVGVGAGLVALTAVVVIAIVVVQMFNGTRVADEQRPPAGATSRFGILLGAAPSADVPHLVVWEDPQCPACKAYEEQYGALIEQLVEEGVITAEVRMAHFLDAQLFNDSSERAALALAAAADVGYYRQYHRVLFENQPHEGAGFTKEQLREEFPALAGIQGENLTRFQELYDVSPFQEFVDSAQDRFAEEAGRTPVYRVAGQELQFFKDNQQVIQPTREALVPAIKKLWESNGQNNNF